MRGPIRVIGNTSKATAASCQFKNSIRTKPAIDSRNGSAALLAKLLIDPSKADRSMENRERISPRLVRAKYDAGKFWTCSNRRERTSAMTQAASLASQRSYQTA